MAKKPSQTIYVKLKRIIAGLLLGAFIGFGLEYVGVCWAPRDPILRFLFDLPLGAVTGAGAFIGGLLAVIHVRRYMRIEKQFAKYLTFVPKNAGFLIKEIIRQMRYRKKIQDDVMSELVTHFEDELKDCKTDTEKEKKAQQLITEFGDVKLLAVLMRRAKIRCRPLWQTVFARACQTVVILFITFIVYLAWFLTGKPVVTVDYVAELNRIVCPAADENLNAAPLYNEAAKLYVELPDNIPKLLGTKYDKATIEQKQLIERWLVDNKDTLELVIAGTQKPHYWQKYEEGKEMEGMMPVLLPHLGGFRRLAYSLRWRIWLSAEQGRYEDAFKDIKTCYRFGRHLRGDKTLIEQLVGIAIEALAIKTLHGILSKHEIDSATLAKLQQDFEQMITDENFTISMKWERLAMYDEIQRCFTEDRLGGGHLYPPRLIAIGESWTEKPQYSLPLIIYGTILSPKNWPGALRVLFTHPNKKETREMTNQLYIYWDNISRKSPAQIHAEGIDIEKESLEIVRGNIFLEIFTPTLSRASAQGHRSRTHIEAVLTIIAILRYNKDLGDYPDNLGELKTTGYLKQLPMDAFSDKPLVYRKTDDNFILYSVGLNFTDDSGAVAEVDGRPRKWGTKEQGDVVFWPVSKL